MADSESTAEPQPTSPERLFALVLGALFAVGALGTSSHYLLEAAEAVTFGGDPDRDAAAWGVVAAMLAVVTGYVLALPGRGFFALFTALFVAAILLLPMLVKIVADVNPARSWTDFLLESFVSSAAIPLAIMFASGTAETTAERLGWRMPWQAWLLTPLMVGVLMFSLAADWQPIPWEVRDEVRLQIIAMHATIGGMIYVVLAVLAPIGQELLYRGFLMRAIAEATNVTVGVVVTAAVFAVVYAVFAARVYAMFAGDVFWQMFFYYFVFGVILAYSVAASKSVVPAIVAHGVVNAWWINDALSG